MTSADSPPSHAEHIRCPLCDADDTIELVPTTLNPDKPSTWAPYACTSSGYGRHGPIVRCRQCGLVYANPRPPVSDVMKKYEAVEDPLYVAERAGRILTFEHHLKPMERVTGPAEGRRLLDVGAYTGVFVEIAAQHGWEAWGLEPSAWAVAQARARGRQMHQGTLENADIPPASFQVVTMWDVIEHVTDPLGTLQAAWRILEPGGLLVVHTMDLNSAFARLMGKRWPWFMEMHLTYFTRATMQRMLDEAGFRVDWMGAQGRYLQAGYLASRVTALLPFAGRPMEWLVSALRLRQVCLRINLGDLFTTYATKVG